ncbi:MAG: MATE family efflux transporter, partial [Bdellovibrionota bacterium]
MDLIARTRKEKWREIITIAWPLIVANSFWNIQLTIDRVFLGQYSTEALAASMAVMGVFWTPMALLQQTSAYVTTFVAQYFGAKRFNMIGPALWQAIYIALCGGLLFMLLLFIAEPLFNFIGHEEKTRLLEIEYFKSLCYSAMPTAIVAAVSGYYTGLGNTKIIMWINCIALIANVILDYLFIFGNLGFPEMGVTGAGYATGLATWCGAFYGLWLIFKDKHAAEYEIIKNWRMNADLMKRFIKYGLPSGLQWALEGLAFTVFLIIIGRMPNGTGALAASGIVVTVMMLAIMPAIGVAQAVMVLVGQHLGEKNPHLAVDNTWSGVQVAAMYIISVGITFLLFPQFYLSWFHNERNAEVWGQVSVIVPYLLMFVALFTTFDSMNLVFSFALKGAGDTRYVTAVALALPWPLMIIPTYLMKDW